MKKPSSKAWYFSKFAETFNTAKKLTRSAQKVESTNI
jgi:hypothetical protein